MHYHMKIPKLRQDQQLRETMGQKVSKETTRVKRNEKKLLDCQLRL